MNKNWFGVGTRTSNQRNQSWHGARHWHKRGSRVWQRHLALCLRCTGAGGGVAHGMASRGVRVGCESKDRVHVANGGSRGGERGSARTPVSANFLMCKQFLSTFLCACAIYLVRVLMHPPPCSASVHYAMCMCSVAISHVAWLDISWHACVLRST